MVFLLTKRNKCLPKNALIELTVQYILECNYCYWTPQENTLPNKREKRDVLAVVALCHKVHACYVQVMYTSLNHVWCVRIEY